MEFSVICSYDGTSTKFISVAFDSESNKFEDFWRQSACVNTALLSMIAKQQADKEMVKGRFLNKYVESLPWDGIQEIEDIEVKIVET